MTQEYNGFHVGDYVIFENDKEKVIGVVLERMNDLFHNVIQIRFENVVTFTKRKTMEVPADKCFKACEGCCGWGEITIPAHQQGGDICDEETYECKFCHGTGYDPRS